MPKFARPNSYTGKQSNQNWTGDVRAANATEAASGTAEGLYISPSTLSDAVVALVPNATNTVAGIVKVTAAPYETGVVATKSYADALAIAGAPAWSETVSGIGQLSTNAEATTGTDDNTAMTPLKVKAAIAAGFPVTGGAGSFTTLAASGLSSLSGSATILTAGTALNLASDADTAAVNIGTGAAARTITVGNVSGATAVVVNTGTGHFTVTTTGSGDIILNSDDTMLLDADGVLELNSSAGVIGIGNDADAQNINIGTGAAQRVITIGNSTSATQLVLNSGTAGINIGANAVAQNITIGNDTGATALAFDAGTGGITVGTNAIAHLITIGNVTGATGVAINVGTGNFALNGVAGSTYAVGAATTTGTITIGGTAQTGDLVLGSSSGTNAVKIMNGAGAGTLSLGVVQVAGAINMGTAMTTGTITIGGTGLQTGTIALAPGTGAQTVNIATGGTGVKTVNIATGAIGNIVTIGSITAAASLDLKVGTGNFTLNGAATSTYTVGAATTSGTISIGGTAQTGTGTIFGGTGAQTIDIANNTGIKTINIAGDSATSANIIKIGTGAAAQTVTVGSTNTTSTTTINSGSGNVNVTGGHLSIATVAKTLLVNGGAATDFIGTGVLTAGTQTISNTNIAAGDVILITRTAVNASTTLGVLTYTISAATSFTVTSVILGTPGSTQTADVSSYAYFIVRPT